MQPSFWHQDNDTMFTLLAYMGFNEGDNVPIWAIALAQEMIDNGWHK